MNTFQFPMKMVKRQVYDRIAVQDQISKTELLQEMDITSSSLNRILDELVREGWISESGQGQSTGGRRPTLYRIDPTHRYILGLEISRVYSVLGLYDLQMNTIASYRWFMDEQMTPERLVDYVEERIDWMLNDYQLTWSQIIGIGIGAVGPLDREKGIILNPVYFPATGWKNVAICQMLNERTGLMAVLENGANTALIGEHWAVRDENMQHMLFVNVGAGIRSAMMSGGQLVRGAVDREGSIGQMIIQTDGERLHDQGNYGALEAFASVQALEQQVRQRMKLGMDIWEAAEDLTPEQVHFDTLITGLNQGNIFLQELFARSAGYMGIGLANIIHILLPEKVILGGALINANPSYYEQAIAVARKKVGYDDSYQPIFSKGVLQERAVAVGAAVMILQQMEL
ncbi:ROK family transcriptional regulator [Paenibacillus nuruki]|uniref:ROK family transcriptional regulator n=1 Tax=Paenibacillus nuruki TaxID=1886670 RepID=UPI00280528D8|nr:ROK family transcriptional regulator [Paenibacillus nuruki]CAJ1316819.1 Sugar kinase [Paenibacillus nuruki]